MIKPSNIKSAPIVRPAFNAFSLFDHQNGRYLPGKHGAHYLNGGLHHINAWCGRANSFKTSAACFIDTTVMVRQNPAWMEIMDTEGTFSHMRIDDFLDGMPEISYLAKAIEANHPEADFVDLNSEELIRLGKLNVVTLVELLGDTWWFDRRKDSEDRAKIKEKDMRTTPFYELDGSFRKIPDPWLYLIDSFTEFKITSIEKMHDKGGVGSSDLNTEAMRSGGAKSQMIGQMTIVNGRGGYYITMTAHVGDEIKMDQYAPSHRKLAGLKGDLKLKGVPEKFTFTPAVCYMATASSSLLDDNKFPKYPHPDKEPVKGDSDLQLVRFEQLRGKSGPTGYFLDLIFSQAEGLLVGLTEFYFILELCKGYGLDIKGNNLGFRLDIYPEVYFTRNNVRKLLRDDPKFARAMSITAACGYMHYHWVKHPIAMRMSMADLYTRIKDQGYDWDEILTDTVEYWYFEDMAEYIGKPTLTAYTLQRMALGEHHATYLKTHPKTIKAVKPNTDSDNQVL